MKCVCLSEKVNATNGIQINLIQMDNVLWRGLKNESVRRYLFIRRDVDT